jgi:pimeloyl-ACP methyl ester carboxylesterase
MMSDASSDAATTVPAVPGALRPPSFRSLVGSRGGQSVVVDGVRLVYDDVGTGPVIVCLHAIGHGAGDYRPFARTMASEHRVIALDWPGHGSSQSDRVPTSASRYAELLEGFLAALDLRRVIVIGNSIGGAAALELAAKHPERVRALVVANPGGTFRRSAFTRLFITMMSRFFGAGARGAFWYRRAFASFCRLVLPRRPAHEQRARIIASASEVAPLLRDAWASFARPESDLRPLLPRIEAPVLVTWAMRDRFNPLWANAPAIATLPRSTTVRFSAGHAPFLETPDEFVAAFRAFVREHAPA